MRILLFLACVHFATSRIHKLEIQNDLRKFIPLTTFGFYKHGILDVKLKQFKAEPFNETHMFGFTLEKILSDAMVSYADNHQDQCVLQKPIDSSEDKFAIYFIMDFKNKVLRVNNSEPKKVFIFKDRIHLPETKSHTLLPARPRREDKSAPNISTVPLNATDTQFLIYIASEKAEGLYNLYFYNCPNYNTENSVKLSFTVEIEENNNGNFLSAGEMPLPALYFMMALLFCLSGSFWVFILYTSKHPVFKIHYLMALLVYLKSLSLLFHGINYHFIQTKGEHVAAWAILYYVIHLLKGSVLFIVIVLVGTGWTFIKHILSEKDKKIFMIVIPLQVLANVAEIILEESEEGDVEHGTWWDIFNLVDLLCCGAILFPVVWSIRHLQEASHTDGKAAINLRKLKLFRHFYIMVVCYIYFTRIIAYLLRITVPFQYEWLDKMFIEMATYVFFVLTGYKFRPASANPYFQVPSEEEEDDKEMNIVITESGLTEGLRKLNRIESEEETEGEKDLLISKRESSHDLD